MDTEAKMPTDRERIAVVESQVDGLRSQVGELRDEVRHHAGRSEDRHREVMTALGLRDTRTPRQGPSRTPASSSRYTITFAPGSLGEVTKLLSVLVPLIAAIGTAGFFGAKAGAPAQHQEEAGP